MITSENLQKRDVVFKPGDTVKVHYRVVEGNRERVQVFEGLCIARKGGGIDETFTVRKNSFGVNVERIFPLHSPKIADIQVSRRGAVRRAKLYYIRDKVGKKARVNKARYPGHARPQRGWRTSRSPAGARCAGRSSTTSATRLARRPASRRPANPGKLGTTQVSRRPDETPLYAF